MVPVLCKDGQIGLATAGHVAVQDIVLSREEADILEPVQDVDRHDALTEIREHIRERNNATALITEGSADVDDFVRATEEGKFLEEIGGRRYDGPIAIIDSPTTDPPLSFDEDILEDILSLAY